MAKFAFAVVAALLCSQALLVTSAAVPQQSSHDEVLQFLEKSITDLELMLGDSMEVKEGSVRNPFTCVTHVYTAYTIVRELKNIIKAYHDNVQNTKAHLAQCQEQPDPATIEACTQKVNAESSEANRVNLQKAYALVPKIIELATAFKRCLWDTAAY